MRASACQYLTAPKRARSKPRQLAGAGQSVTTLAESENQTPVFHACGIPRSQRPGLSSSPTHQVQGSCACSLRACSACCRALPAWLPCPGFSESRTMFTSRCTHLSCFFIPDEDVDIRCLHQLTECCQLQVN